MQINGIGCGNCRGFLPVLMLLTALFVLAFCLPVLAQVDDTPATTEADDKPADTENAGEETEPAEKPKKKPPFGKYGEWIKHTENLLLNMDMWGSTSTIPEGYLVPIVGWGTQRAFKRYDENRKLVDIVPILTAPDPFHSKGEFFRFDFNIFGKLDGYFFGAMYGVTDRFSVGFTSMFTVLDITMDPIFTPGSCDKLGIATREEFYQMLELLGRPRPKHSYHSDGVDWGDTTLTASWNYYRIKWFSTGSNLNVFLPTSHRADPDQAIIFGLGPDLDTGNGAFGLGLSQMFDFRPPKPADFVSFSIGLEGAFYFQSKRKSPHFFKPDQDVWDYMAAQGVELDIFPDLSDMDDFYYYTPPPWVAVSGGIGAGPVSITYRHGWGFEADFQSNSPGFEKVIDEIGLVGTGDDGKIIVAAGIPLSPIFIPALAQVRFEYVTDGRNNLVFRDIYQVGLGFIIPLHIPDRYKMGGKNK